jgi:hypothetical protein
MQHFDSGVQSEHRLIRAIRAILHALVHDTPTAWADAALILYARLTGAERAALARAVAGAPPETAPLHMKPMAAASTWARRANPAMRSAVATSAFRAMTPEERQRFTAWATSLPETEGHDDAR